MDKQAVVIDNDTNYTKMGYGGSLDQILSFPQLFLIKRVLKGY